MEAKNSNIVIVNRTTNGTPISDKKDELTSQWNATSYRYASIRSMSSSNPKPYTGLGYCKNKPYDTALELRLIKLLFPSIIGMDYNEANAVEFRNRVNQFYDALTTSIPSQGKELEIGLTVSNNEPIDNENIPLNINDFILYKALFENMPSYVAESEKEGNGVSFYLFYTVHKSQEDKKTLAIAELSSTSQSLYNQIKDIKDVSFIIKALKLPFDKDYPIKNSITLVNYSREEPENFINEVNLYTESPLKYKIRSLIADCVEYNIIERRSNNQYLDVATDKIIGNSLKELIDFLASPANKETLYAYKNRLLESLQ